MKKNLLLFFFTSFLFFNVDVFAQDERIQLVFLRHSEKAGGQDPELSLRGKKYAKTLVDFFSESKFDAIYSTAFKRTMETVEEVAKHQKVEIKNYSPLDSNFLKMQVLNKQKVLIVGHSNTVPQLINAFVPSAQLEELDESDYGKVFIVNYFPNEPIKSSVFILNTKVFLD